MAEGDCGAGESTLMARETAAEFFQIAALMLGDENEAAELVEQTVAKVEADPCCEQAAAHDEARNRLVENAVRRLAQQHPDEFSNPDKQEASGSCIEADEERAAALNNEQLAVLLQGAGRARVREWLERLTPALRAIFVLRAVVRQDNERTAESLRASEVQGAHSWTSDGVGRAYRQALCSLATSLVVSTAVATPA